MNPLSALQEQFPLSSKKFWKKIIGRLLVACVVLIITTGFSIGTIINRSEFFDPYLAVHIAGAAIVIIFIVVVTYLVSYSYYIKVYIKNYYYSGESDFITIKKGVFAPSEIHVQWLKIQDVYVDQDIADRLLGLYDVHISSATATSGIEAHIDGVDAVTADGLKKFLLNKIVSSGKGPQIPTQQGSDPVKPVTTNLAEEISSTVYPLSKKWFALSVTLGFLWPFVLLVILIGFSLPSIYAINSSIPASSVGASYPNYLGVYIYGFLYVILGLLYCISSIIRLFLWRKNYAFKFTPDMLYYRQGALVVSEKNMPYSSIQNVTVIQGFFERFFGLAKVYVENAAQQAYYHNGTARYIAGGITLQGLSLADANKITDVLKAIVLANHSSQYGI